MSDKDLKKLRTIVDRIVTDSHTSYQEWLGNAVLSVERPSSHAEELTDPISNREEDNGSDHMLFRS